MNLIDFLKQPWHWAVAGILIAAVKFILIFFGKSFGFSSNLRIICAACGAGDKVEFFKFDWKAQIWNLVFPINKNLWSSSFVLHVGGLSFVLLSFFYYIIDVKGYKRWAFFFTIIGMNSILIYLSDNFINWKYTTTAIFQWLGQLVGDPYSLVVSAVCIVLVKWAFLYFLSKKDVFLRV